MDRYMVRPRGRVPESPLRQFELLLWDFSSGFPMANHSDLPGLQSIFDVS